MGLVRYQNANREFPKFHKQETFHGGTVMKQLKVRWFIVTVAAVLCIGAGAI